MKPPKPSTEQRVLHALRDFKERLRQDKLQASQADSTAVIGLVRTSSDSDVSAVSRRLLRTRQETGTAVFVVVDGSKSSLALRIATDIGSVVQCVDVHEANNGSVYAAHLAISGIMRRYFACALLVVDAGPSRGAALFKSMDRALKDGDPILAEARENTTDSPECKSGLLDAILACRDGGVPTTVGMPPLSIAFSSRYLLTKPRIAEIIATALNCREQEKIAWNISCFEYGADSLSAVEIRNQLQKVAGTALPLTLLFEYPTVDALDLYLRSAPFGAQISANNESCGRGPFPVSRGQLALWGIQQLNPASTDYDLSFTIGLKQHTSYKTLAESIRLTLQRHALLRARFIESNGELVQFIDPVPTDVLKIVDTATPATQPIKLIGGEVARFSLVSTTDGAQLVILCHHIVADYDSIRILIRDIERFYIALSREEIPTVVTECEYLNCVRREQSLPHAERMELIERWKRRLGENLPILFASKPASKPRVSESYLSAMAYHHPIATELALQIKRSATSLGMTVYQFMFAAYALFLMETTGSNEVVVGTTVSLRDSEAELNAVGYFINPLPVRFCYAAESTWEEYVKTHQPRIVETLLDRLLPFAELVQHLSIRREALVSVVFQTMFTWLPQRNSADEQADGPFVKAQLPEGHHAGNTTHDLVLMVQQIDDAMHCTWCYRSPLFAAAEIEVFSQRYQKLLETVTAKAGITIPFRQQDNGREEMLI